MRLVVVDLDDPKMRLEMRDAIMNVYGGLVGSTMRRVEAAVAVLERHGRPVPEGE